MMRTRWLKWSAALLVGVLVSPAGAGESPLAQLPADTPVLISIRGIQGTKDRLATMIKNACPDLGPKAVAHVEELIDKGLEGRKLTGLEPNGPVFLAMVALPNIGGEEPPVALVAKAIDVKAFIKGILTDEERKNLATVKGAGYQTATLNGKEVYFLDRNGYVVMANAKEAVDKFSGKQQTGLDATIGKNVAGRLLESDVAVYVDMKAVNKQFGEALQGARQALPFFIDQAAENTAGQLDKTTVKLIKGMMEGMFQAIQDGRHVLVTASFRPEGLGFHAEAGFLKDSQTNKFLKEMKPSPLDGLAALPAGYFGYTEMAWGPEAFKLIQPLALSMMASGEGTNEEALKQALDQLAAAGPETQRMASGLRGRGLQVLRFADPAKAADAQLKAYQAMKDVKKLASMHLKEKPVVRANAETFRGIKFNYFGVKYDLEEQFKNLPGNAEQMAEALRKLSGDGINLWFGAGDGVLLEVQAKDWKAAEKQLAQYLDKQVPVGEKEKGFSQTREHLPAKATLVALLSVPRLIDAGVQYGSALMQSLGQQALPPIPPHKGPESYLGISVTLRPGNTSLDLWIPGATAREVQRVVEAFQKGQGGN
jgi:hypothetical protein